MAKKSKNDETETEVTEAPAEAPQDTGSDETEQSERDPADIGEAVQQHRERLERADKVRGW